MAMRAFTTQTIGTETSLRNTKAFYWDGITNGDTLEPVELGNFQDKTVSLVGDFATSASFTFYGTNYDSMVTKNDAGKVTALAVQPDLVSATNLWVPIKDAQGNAMTYTAKDGEPIAPIYKYITGKMTAGSATLRASLFCTRT